MKLNENADKYPLLIILMRKLIAKGDRIWHKGAFSKLQVERIGTVSVDRAASFDTPEYHGPAYDIKVFHGIGLTMTPDEAETKYELVQMPKKSDQEWDDWELKRIYPKRKVEEAKRQPLETPLVMMILKRELDKGNKVLIDFRKDGSRHEGVVYQVRIEPNAFVSTIMYNDDGVLDLVLIDNATAEEDATLCKNPTGTLTLTNTSELDEGKADAPIWVDLINMLISKGEKVYTWDGDNHDDDGIVCSINKAVAGSDGLVYLLCTYAKAWAGNGAMAGTNAGEIVCDGDLDDYRFEKIDGIHWLKAPHEA
jgi:hypothetical protein